MMPFLKADGLLEEVGRNIYAATIAAKAWCESNDDLNFIRIIHAHRRFVGEMIACAKNDVTRNDIYTEAQKYGINREKARWVMGFLLEAGLLEETQYLHVKATPLGVQFASDLPLMPPPAIDETNHIVGAGMKNEAGLKGVTAESVNHDLFDRLRLSARDPMAESKSSGVSKEEIGILKQINSASAKENETYAIQEEKYCVHRLRALADAIERGSSE